jgi:hypothetical protein
MACDRAVVPDRPGNAGEPSMNKPKFKIEDVAAALLESRGRASAAAKILSGLYGGSCSSRTVRNYLKRHPELQAALRAQRQRVLREAGQIFRRALRQRVGHRVRRRRGQAGQIFQKSE